MHGIIFCPFTKTILRSLIATKLVINNQAIEKGNSRHRDIDARRNQCGCVIKQVANTCRGHILLNENDFTTTFSCVSVSLFHFVFFFFSQRISYANVYRLCSYHGSFFYYPVYAIQQNWVDKSYRKLCMLELAKTPNIGKLITNLCIDKTFGKIVCNTT